MAISGYDGDGGESGAAAEAGACCQVSHLFFIVYAVHALD